MKAPLRHGLQNASLLVASCIAGLLLAEGVLRVHNPIDVRLRGDRLVLPANKTYKYESHLGNGSDTLIVHTKNSLGFRGPDIPPLGLASHLSIIAVGGSTTECSHLSDGDDWPAVLGRLLQADFNHIWVNNAGLDGHSTVGHTILLNESIVSIKPNVIVYLVGINDQARGEADIQSAANIRGPLIFSSLEGFVKSLSAHSEVASLGLAAYRYIRAKSTGLPHRRVDVRSLPHTDANSPLLTVNTRPGLTKELAQYEERLTKLVEQTQNAGIIPVLVTQPLLYGVGVDRSTRVNLESILVRPGITGRAAWTTLNFYNEVTRRIGQRKHLLTIDLARELSKDSDYFYDGTHFTRKGAAQVAKLTYKHLRPFLLEAYPKLVRGKGTD